MIWIYIYVYNNVVHTDINEEDNRGTYKNENNSKIISFNMTFGINNATVANNHNVDDNDN